MNRYLIIALALLAIVTLRLRSQIPAQNSPAALFTAMKTQNQDTLTKQEATLKALDDMAKDADQIKIFAKRG